MAVVAIAFTIVGVLWSSGAGGPRAEVVTDSSAPQGWQTIDFEGIRVDIPADWERSDMDDCEFRFEHWASPGSPACGSSGGVAFYASATFDPAHGPGIRSSEFNGDPDWGGYVDIGEFAVYASDDDRELIGTILGSAREAQE